MSDGTVDGIRVATAPVSYGVYGYPSQDDPATYDPDALLAAMSSAGFKATELGPPGYFGPPAGIEAVFERHRLDVAGAYAAIRFSEPQYVSSDFQTALQTIEELAVFASHEPRLILADGGSELLNAHPGRRAVDANLALDRDGWRELKAITRELSDKAGAVGVRSAFHPHVSTFIETPVEVERLLTETDLPLVFDTGHLLLGGSDIIESLRIWRSRVEHVHLKDVRTEVLEEARRTGKRHTEEWWHRACVTLGSGDVDLTGFLSDLIRHGYRGWITIEQDRPPGTVAGYSAAAEGDSRNLAWLQAELDRLAR